MDEKCHRFGSTISEQWGRSSITTRAETFVIREPSNETVNRCPGAYRYETARRLHHQRERISDALFARYDADSDARTQPTRAHEDSMAVFVLGIVSLGSIAFSFLFSFLVFAAWREERRMASLPHGQGESRRGMLETVADRALAEVGRLFVVSDATPSDNREPDADEAKPPCGQEQAYSAPTLPRRPQTEETTRHAL
jgi:hypothetical protein